MSKNTSATSNGTIERRIREGRGDGRGPDYIPWDHVRDGPSVGQSNRIKGWKTGRVHELFNILELDYFYVLEWSQAVTDIRERFPLLPLRKTQDIAQVSGLRHPANSKDEPSVMTTDFVLTVINGPKPIEFARSVITSQGLQASRTIRRFEIERRYWELCEVDWGIVTEREIPITLARNVKLLHPYKEMGDLIRLSNRDVKDIAIRLTQKAVQTKAALRESTAECDRELGLDRGTSLRVAYHLLANRKWLVDMNLAVDPGQTLPLLGHAPDDALIAEEADQ
jgi:hypothetical protein